MNADMEDQTTEAANPHTFTISEEFPSNNLEVACEGCDWRIEFTGRITDAARRQAGRLTAEHAAVNDLSAKVHAFIDGRREVFVALKNCPGSNMDDYMRWQGHAEARRALAETLGLELDQESGGLANRSERAL